MMEIKSQDIIAVFVILSLLMLKIYGIDSNFDAILALILGYYFGFRKHEVISKPPEESK